MACGFVGFFFSCVCFGLLWCVRVMHLQFFGVSFFFPLQVFDTCFEYWVVEGRSIKAINLASIPLQGTGAVHGREKGE